MDSKLEKARAQRRQGIRYGVIDGVEVVIKPLPKLRTKGNGSPPPPPPETIIEREVWDAVFPLFPEAYLKFMPSGEDASYVRLANVTYGDCLLQRNPVLARIIVIIFGMVHPGASRFTVHYDDENHCNLMRSNLIVEAPDPQRPGGGRARASEDDVDEVLRRAELAEKDGWRWPEPWVHPKKRGGKS